MGPALAAHLFMCMCSLHLRSCPFACPRAGLAPDHTACLPACLPPTLLQPAALAPCAQLILHSLDPASSQYNQPLALELYGRIDSELLRHSLQALAMRHDVLRTSYRATPDGSWQPVVHPPTSPMAQVPFALVDLTTRVQQLEVDSAELQGLLVEVRTHAVFGWRPHKNVCCSRCINQLPQFCLYNAPLLCFAGGQQAVRPAFRASHPSCHAKVSLKGTFIAQPAYMLKLSGYSLLLLWARRLMPAADLEGLVFPLLGPYTVQALLHYLSTAPSNSSHRY